jgi:hypothetical protein
MLTTPMTRKPSLLRLHFLLLLLLLLLLFAHECSGRRGS